VQKGNATFVNLGQPKIMQLSQHQSKTSNPYTNMEQQPQRVGTAPTGSLLFGQQQQRPHTRQHETTMRPGTSGLP